jgi:hypothetical protein
MTPKELSVEDLILLKNQGKLQGEFKNIPDAVYHAGPGISRSDLAKVMKSPEHLDYSKEQQNSESTALMIGNAVHCYILEPEKFEETYVCGPEGKNRTHKVVKEILNDLPDDKKLLLFNEMEEIVEMGEKFKAHPVCAEFLDGSDKEVTYYWNDPKTGLLLKARLDIVHPKLGVMDVKTTRDDARRTEFSKTCLRYNYDLQAAHYWYGSVASMGKDYKFYFGVIEKQPPYGIVVHKADMGFIECGLEIQEYLCNKLNNYMEGKGSYGYEPVINNLALPPWGFDLDARLERRK